MRKKGYKEPIYIEGYRDKVKLEFDVKKKDACAEDSFRNDLVDSILSFFDTGISLVRIAVPISIDMSGEEDYRLTCKGYTSKDCTSREIERMVDKYIPYNPYVNSVNNIAVEII